LWRFYKHCNVLYWVQPCSTKLRATGIFGIFWNIPRNFGQKVGNSALKILGNFIGNIRASLYLSDTRIALSANALFRLTLPRRATNYAYFLGCTNRSSRIVPFS
jgi:hypothetical protein